MNFYESRNHGSEDCKIDSEMGETAEEKWGEISKETGEMGKKYYEDRGKDISTGVHFPSWCNWIELKILK